MKKSNQTVRLTGVPEDATTEEIERQANADLEVKSPSWKIKFKFSSGRPRDGVCSSSGLLASSLAQQKDLKTATITFTSSALKDRALRNWEERRSKTRKGAYIDDDFRGITVLHSGSSGQRVDLDICAVHGLNGHAFDTWMGETQMWLRDHLPNHPPNHPDFKNSRIMTYGYDTQLLNGRGTQSRFEDYASQLLVLLGQERKTAEERARPIIFLCHSMGGLIARLAMVRYEKYPQLHQEVSLGPRGLLLLSTPNAGALDAQWSDLSLALGGALGLRRNLIDELKILNPHHIDAVNDWETLQYKPLVRCYCESSSTVIASGITRQVVAQASAGFLTNTATILPETDHHSVCKFEKSISPAFDMVKAGLCEMRADLLSGVNQVPATAANVYRVGRPEATAPSYPLPKPFVFDHGFRKPSRNVVQRSKLLQETTKTINESASSQCMLILTGIAGSGKTELLLDYMKQRSSESNVVILSAKSYAGLREKLEQYALMFGHDVILHHRAIGPRTLDMWKSYTPAVQANLFLAWAATVESDCIIVLDELDDIKDASDIAKDLPQTARVVVSTRNPSVFKELKSKFSCVYLPVFDMEIEEATQLLASLVASTTVEISPFQLTHLVEGLDRHPFAICAASSYLSELQSYQDPSEQHRAADVLLNALEGNDIRARKDFFEFDDVCNSSISELFGTIMGHLRKHTAEQDFQTSVQPLLQAVAHLSDYKNECHFTTFFHAVKLVISKFSRAEHNFDEVFTRDIRTERKTLGKATQSSLIVTRDNIMYMPALWRDCIMLYECSFPKDVKYWLQQILLLCYLYSKYDGNSNISGPKKLDPYVKNCARIAKRYDIEIYSTFTHPEQETWLSGVLEQDGVAAPFLGLLDDCREVQKLYAKRPAEECSGIYAALAKKYTHLKQQYPICRTDFTIRRTTAEIDKIMEELAIGVGNTMWNSS